MKVHKDLRAHRGIPSFSLPACECAICTLTGVLISTDSVLISVLPVLISTLTVLISTLTDQYLTGAVAQTLARNLMKRWDDDAAQDSETRLDAALVPAGSVVVVVVRVIIVVVILVIVVVTRQYINNSSTATTS